MLDLLASYLPKCLFSWKLDKAFNLIRSVLAIMASIASKRLWDTFSRMPIPVVHSEDLVQIQVQTLKLIFCTGQVIIKQAKAVRTNRA